MSRNALVGIVKKSSRAAKRSLSESSVEELRKNNSSSSSQDEEDGPLQPLVEKNKLTRKHFTYQHKIGVLPTDIFAIGGGNIFGRHSQRISDTIDVCLRIILVFIFIKMETTPAFERTIHVEELWMYKHPRRRDYVSPAALLLAVVLGPFLVTLLHLIFTKDQRDFRAANWSWTLSLCLNGLTTSLLKVSVGRPRPDFFYRCFPDGIVRKSDHVTDDLLDSFNCTGNLYDVNEGRKSFPSGHSSFAFAGFGFIAFYVAAKLNAFNRRGRGESWRLFISITPLFIAALVAVSRTCDYHHHWQDVLVGSIIGLSVSHIVYRQYYPSIFSMNCHQPYPRKLYPATELTTKTNLISGHKARFRAYKQLPREEVGDSNILYDNEETNSEQTTLLTGYKTDNKWF
ncbi:phospholipid phosphatase 5 [Glossina fuscipes]|uniref:Phospholipid phosphatase 5 n=1 Tax=Glossina fuscipes TaxID=7396 RepID=A0A9C5ZE81_9MUSC|nr:phospholipid phosphatase 5 [Glossina fuscipes]